MYPIFPAQATNPFYDHPFQSLKDLLPMLRWARGVGTLPDPLMMPRLRVDRGAIKFVLSGKQLPYALSPTVFSIYVREPTRCYTVTFPEDL